MHALQIIEDYELEYYEASNDQQREQIRQLEAHYDEAIGLARAEERIPQPEIDVVPQRFAERVPVK